MNEAGAMSCQASDGRLEIRDLEGKANLAGDPGADLELVDGRCLSLVEDLEGGAAKVQDERASLVFRPDLRGLESESLSIERRQTIEVPGREGNSQFEDGRDLLGGD